MWVEELRAFRERGGYWFAGECNPQTTIKFLACCLGHSEDFWVGFLLCVTIIDGVYHPGLHRSCPSPPFTNYHIHISIFLNAEEGQHGHDRCSAANMRRFASRSEGTPTNNGTATEPELEYAPYPYNGPTYCYEKCLEWPSPLFFWWLIEVLHCVVSWRAKNTRNIRFLQEGLL